MQVCFTTHNYRLTRVICSIISVDKFFTESRTVSTAAAIEEPDREEDLQLNDQDDLDFERFYKELDQQRKSTTEQIVALSAAIELVVRSHLVISNMSFIMD